MIYVTGDTHGDIDFNKLIVFSKEHPSLNYNDYMIICGDFGGVWNAYRLKDDLAPYESLPFTVLFVDGNHENFDLLDAYPTTLWHGGKIHRISEHIIHLMRGQIYTIESSTFFTFGGATSTDKYLRSYGVSWWPQENPTLAEFNESVENLKTVNNKVDYIITHACDEQALKLLLINPYGGFEVYPENKMLTYFEENVNYKHWYFGHYHMDRDLNDYKTVLYNKIIKL